MWLGLVGLCEWLEPAGANAPSLCKFNAITGIACPTCGTTRAVKAVGDGRFIDAWLFNPFVVTAICLAGAWLVMRIVTGRAIQLSLSPGMRALMWISISALFLLNWLYLIVRGV